MTEQTNVKLLRGRHGTLRVDPALAAWLGELTARWSYLEWLMAQLVVTLTGMSWEHASAITFAVNATSTRVDIVRLIAERSPEGEPQREAALAAIAVVTRLQKRRNAYIHHLWFSETATGAAYTFDYRADMNGPHGIVKRHTVKALKGFVGEVTEACQTVASASGKPIPEPLIDDLRNPFPKPPRRWSATKFAPASTSID